MKYTLGLDVGTNSIGWAVLELNTNGEPQRIEKLGSRIFTDGRHPKDGTTLASKRRQKRHERRRRDRLHQRKKLVLNQLVSMGLFPQSEQEQQDLKSLDVLTLRANGVSKQLSAYELGRVFYYLNLKRGFKSNRKGGSEEDKANKISERIKKLQEQLKENDFKTVGQYLHDRYIKGLSTKATIENDFHLLRQLIEDEFDFIVETQSKFFPEISDEQWNTLRNRMFHQRPLKPVETGTCSLFEDKKRTYKYMPSFEEYRFLTELFNLSYQDENFHSHSLSSEQIFKVFHELKNTREATYTKIKKLLKLPSDLSFSIERSKSKDKIKISTTNHFFSKSLLFAEEWASLDLKLKDEVAEIYFSDMSVEEIKKGLLQLKIDSEIIENLLEEKVPNVQEATCSYSKEALQKIVSLILEEERHPTLIVDDLFKNEKEETSLIDRLDYYGASIPDSMQPIPQHIKDNNLTLNEDEKRYGKIANPTVHAALNQIRQVVNDLIEQYGKPTNIHIEFARDLKKSKEERDFDNRKKKKNEELNEQVRDFIEKHNQKPSAFNFERVKLWFELDAMNNQVCAYSGKTISARMVLSDEVQVDHILPFSRTLDDSLANKVLVLASENVKKRNRTPYEAFGQDTEKWASIQELAKRLPYHKQWRFAEDAIKKFEEKDQFLQRHLNDTRYISKIAKKYLGSITDPYKIVASRGQMTSIIRGKLGLNQFIQKPDGTKNREDHRHHAIDALTVALTSRSYLKRISDASARNQDPNRIPIPEPWKGFIKDADVKFNEIIVSHKVDHGKNGPFMEETCFGLIKNPNKYEEENDFKLITTKSLDSVKDPSTIRSQSLQNLAEKSGVISLAKSGVKKLRVYDVTKENPADIGLIESGLAKITHGKDKQHVKHYQKGDINYLAIWCLPQNITLKSDNHKKRKTDYIFTAIKTFDLNSKNPNDLRPHPAAKLVTKVYKGDTVALEVNNQLNYYIVKSIRAANKKLYFLKINQSSELANETQFIPAYTKLVDYKFRKVSVSPTGVITDNGPLLK
ncbi:type II CRISPR RNA-guided endonuclease Cas9 [Pseudobdellovibrio exovorus]|uniref:CRISPR-associated endonuclease Cas9 n=1 Tax=Pseudobdellovibrio exovorus JSS TaxID=1184267 RepID=M4V7E7_9BACT|nr:type II CRISPR RNA-guided endonuclease Cas9 [Pseudobdellovibrio exovorus]AGH95128.1 CRISPR-associated protein, Csn1 family [Pseudobdellovibrio exovorus JSS]